MKCVATILTFILNCRLIFSNLNFEEKVLNKKKNNNEYMKTIITSSMRFKSETKSLLNSLYYSSNFKKLCEGQKSNRKRKNIFHTVNSTNFNEDKYQYYTYGEIVSQLLDLAKNNDRYLKVETGQKLYNLSNPDGNCGKNKEDKCYNYIAFLTDHSKNSKHKHQIYISGEVHGNEAVGPIASLELIKLFLKHKDTDPWIKYLLKTRLIVVTPMTNPKGYYSGFREEEIIGDFEVQDINRDFPYLVDNDKCMLTIGARLVNELFISHIFSLALTLHGGTESLTYPFGAPNHVVNNQNPIPINYTQKNKTIEIKTSEKTAQIVNQYRKRKISQRGKSTEPPDHNSMSEIADVASYNCGNDKYKVGDMNSVVYPVVGGMEDWAYAGSWEGDNIITQPCIPTSYGGYNKEKTLYDKNYKDALKTIMFLLEISREKKPKDLGKRSKNDECILNIKSNPFSIFKKEVDEDLKKKCLDKNNDGYVARVMRLSLTLIDLLVPYISVDINSSDTNNVIISWVVGGALKVDETFILYNYSMEKSKHKSFKSLNKKNHEYFLNKFKQKSQVYNGQSIWDVNLSNKKVGIFSHTIPKSNGKKYLEFVIMAKVDKNWLQQKNPVPNLRPQTHIVNLRSDSKYSAKSGNFELFGKEYFNSKIYSVEL